VLQLEDVPEVVEWFAVLVITIAEKRIVVIIAKVSAKATAEELQDARRLGKHAANLRNVAWDLHAHQEVERVK